MAGSFVIEKTVKYRFNLRAGNYENILTSELYETKPGAKGGIESVRVNAPDDSRYVRKTAKDGSAFFTLTAANGQVIGRSEMYSSPAARDKGIESVKTNASDATVIDRTGS
jgi:uncharacterized protein YegP (UPF0339 family)